MTSGKKAFNPFWILLTASATLFCITALAWIAAGFGDRESPLNQFLNGHGGTLIAVEAGVTIVLGLLAMMLDSRHTHRGKRDHRPPTGDP